MAEGFPLVSDTCYSLRESFLLPRLTLLQRVVIDYADQFRSQNPSAEQHLNTFHALRWYLDGAKAVQNGAAVVSRAQNEEAKRSPRLVSVSQVCPGKGNPENSSVL